MPDHTESVGLLELASATTERRHGDRMRELPSLRERKRAENRERHSRSAEPDLTLAFQCECARPDCRARLPLEIERHRRALHRFIVCVAHADADTAVGVADHFMVVEAHGAPAALRQPTRARLRSQYSAA
jgi:hypothetical protein